MSFYATREKNEVDPFNNRSKYTCPHIDVCVGSQVTPTSVLLDSGAEFSCVSESYHSHLQACGEVFPEIPVVGVRIVTATGQRSQRVKKQCLLPIRCQGISMDVKALIVPSLVKELVFGADWLSKHGAIIGYRDEDAREVASGERQLKLRDGRHIYVIIKDTGFPPFHEEATPPPPGTFVTATSMEIVDYIQSAWEENNRSRLYTIQEEEGERIEATSEIPTPAAPTDNNETAVKELWTADDSETAADEYKPHVCSPMTYTDGVADPESACAHPHALYAAVQRAQDWWTADCESSWDEEDYTEEDKELHYERYSVNTCIAEKQLSEDESADTSDEEYDSRYRSVAAGGAPREYSVRCLSNAQDLVSSGTPERQCTGAPLKINTAVEMDRAAGQTADMDDFLMSLYGKY